MEEILSTLEALSKTHPESREQMLRLQSLVKLMASEIGFLKKKLFGSKSEQLDPNQMLLLLSGLEAAVPEQRQKEEPPPVPAKSPAKRKARALRFPANMEEVREVLIPEVVKANPEEWVYIGSEERTQIEVVPPKYVRKVIERRKYVHLLDKTQPPVIVPAPAELLPNSYASVSLLLQVILGKYLDHLPLYRQQQIFARQGIEISRQTLSDWMMSIGNWLGVIYDEMKEKLRQSQYLQVDETPIRYLKPGNGHAPKGYLWTYHAPALGVVYEWHTGRGSECLWDMLDGYKGVVQCDGFSAYERYAKRKEAKDIDWLGCWAHVRRKFFESKEDSAYASWMLRQIQLLYAVEKKTKDIGPGLRETIRASESNMILDRIFKSMRKQLARHLPKGPTGKAIAYALAREEHLRTYVKYGLAQIDNNGVENAIRPTAIGKKNHLFFGSECAGKQNAVIYSVLESCKKLGVHPGEYLDDVLHQLPKITNQEARELTPAKWLASRRKNAA